MTDLFDLMLLPVIASLLLTGMHVYLGLHIIERQIIFADLALAQIAALGATVAYLLGFELHSRQNYLIALAFTFLGSLLFTYTRNRKPRFPQEALIGLIYSVAAAGAILALSASPHGGEELKNLMVGHLLLIDRYEVLSILVVYGLIGALHFAFHRPVLLISRDPEEAYSKNINVRGWDLFFYTTFGIVVTSSTEVAGVLLVFTYLIAPAICGILVADTIRGRLITGWLIGSICSIFGVIASYFLDLPIGASIVCVFGIVTVIFIAVFGRESQS